MSRFANAAAHIEWSCVSTDKNTCFRGAAISQRRRKLYVIDQNITYLWVFHLGAVPRLQQRVCLGPATGCSKPDIIKVFDECDVLYIGFETGYGYSALFKLCTEECNAPCLHYQRFSLDEESCFLSDYQLTRVFGNLAVKDQAVLSDGNSILLTGFDMDHCDQLLIAPLLDSANPSARYESIGKKGLRPGEFFDPECVIVDDHDRILVSESGAKRIQVFDGRSTLDHITSLHVTESVYGLAIDSESGRIYFTTDSGVFGLEANTWLTHQFQWSIERHEISPRHARSGIESICVARAATPSSALALMPNELLFRIFEAAYC